MPKQSRHVLSVHFFYLSLSNEVIETFIPQAAFSAPVYFMAKIGWISAAANKHIFEGPAVARDLILLKECGLRQAVEALSKDDYKEILE